MGDAEVTQGQTWTHKTMLTDVIVERIGIPRVLLTNGSRQWWITRETLRKNYRLYEPDAGSGA